MSYSIKIGGPEPGQPGSVYRSGSWNHYENGFAPPTHVKLPIEAYRRWSDRSLSSNRCSVTLLLDLGMTYRTAEVDPGMIYSRLWSELGLIKYGGTLHKWLDSKPDWIGEVLNYVEHQNPVEGPAMYGLLDTTDPAELV